MTSALIVVDLNNDFLPGGALGVPEGFDVIEPLVLFGQSDFVDHVVLTQDYHDVNHIGHRKAAEDSSHEPTFQDGDWPVHCVRGTHGAELSAEIVAAFPDAPVFRKGINPDLEAYSGFDGVLDSAEPGSAMSLKKWIAYNGVDEVFVGGLALDYCVALTAFDAARNSLPTTVLLDATRPVSYIGGVQSVVELYSDGINFDTVGQLLMETV